MKQIIKLLTLLFIVVSICSCSPKRVAKQIEKGVTIEAIENISGSAAGGWVITLRVNNQTSYQPTLSNGQGDIYLDNVLTVHADITESITMPKRAVSSITIPLQISVKHPLKAISLLLRLKEKNFEGVDIAFNATVEMMGVKREIGTDKAPAKSILRRLGYIKD
ncbi:MAG: hypothetical protein IIW52_04150 [Alistipes sp.]|nr:hypothetical protein [Alistipes sp.]